MKIFLSIFIILLLIISSIIGYSIYQIKTIDEESGSCGLAFAKCEHSCENKIDANTFNTAYCKINCLSKYWRCD